MICQDVKQSFISIFNIFLGLEKMIEEHNDQLSYEKIQW